MSVIKNSRFITATAIILMIAATLMVGHDSPTTLEAQSQRPDRPTGLTAAAAPGGERRAPVG